jgi:hypothetical protein
MELNVGTKSSNDCNLADQQERMPRDVLNQYAKQWQVEPNSERFAQKLDEIDPLRHVRQEFLFPKLSTLPKGTSTVDFIVVSRSFHFIKLINHESLSTTIASIYVDIR